MAKADDLVEAADQQRGKAGEGDDVADAQLAMRDQIGADQQHDHHRDGRGQAVQRIGHRPPVEHRVLRIEQVLDIAAQRLGLMAKAVVALQHGDVADRVGHMREHLVVVALDGGLACLGLLHHQPADADIEHAEHQQHHRHPQVHATARSGPAAPAQRPWTDAGA